MWAPIAGPTNVSMRSFMRRLLGRPGAGGNARLHQGLDCALLRLVRTGARA